MFSNIARTKKVEFLILNSILLFVPLFFAYKAGVYPKYELMFESPDSRSYLEVGAEFFNFSQQGDSIIRPFFYSTVLRTWYVIGGVWLVAIMQSILWIAIANFIYYSIKKINRFLLVRITGVLIYVLNLSFIYFIFHGLTEIMSAFLLSWATYLTIKTIKEGLNFKYWIRIILICSLLTVTKPLFYSATIVLLIMGIFKFSKILLESKKRMVYVLLALSPIIIQLSVMKIKYDFFKISKISENTINDYILAQGVREIQGSENPREVVQNMNSNQKKELVFHNWRTFLKLYDKNIEHNFKEITTQPPNYRNFELEKKIKDYNYYLYYISYFFMVLFILVSVFDFWRKKIFINWQQLFIGLFLYFIIFSSGVSFWQGDRLIVYSIPLWITLYTLLLTRLINRNFVALVIQQFKRNKE